MTGAAKDEPAAPLIKPVSDILRQEEKTHLEGRQIICVELTTGVNSRALLLLGNLHKWYSLGVISLREVTDVSGGVADERPKCAP